MGVMGAFAWVHTTVCDEDKKAGGAYIPLWDVSPDERPHLAHNHFYLEGWTLD